MKCITHDNVDAVSTCASCGAGICKACEENSGFRIENKALCNRCNNQTLTEQLQISTKYIRVSIFKSIIYGFLLVYGIFSFIQKYNLMTSNPESTLTMADPVFSLLVIWGLASIGNFFKPQNASVKSQISDALFEFRYPGTSFISKAIGFIIGYAISAVTLPFKLLFLILSIRKEIKIKEHNENYYNNLESV